MPSPGEAGMDWNRASSATSYAHGPACCRGVHIADFFNGQNLRIRVGVGDWPTHGALTSYRPTTNCGPKA